MTGLTRNGNWTREAAADAAFAGGPTRSSPIPRWLRLAGRLIWMAGVFLGAAMSYAGQRVIHPYGLPRATRAAWLQKLCRRLLRVMGMKCALDGPVPLNGLLVCNHLSYVDILVLGAAAPSVFVAKSEVKSWPVFGWFAQRAGTLFVQRDRRTEVGVMTETIGKVLNEGMLVILFPEGTSSNGESVLPFKSSLLEPVARLCHPVTAGRIQYELADGDVGEEVCYWKEMTLLPHLLNLLGKTGLRATIRFAPFRSSATDRKELARQLHAEVSRLRRVPA